ncbi:MAG TPA: CBS domain-containing protein [Bacillota bacterium]|nr:CBS domain-containing protein [Bacillota bacterium]
MHVRVSEIMTRDVVTLKPEHSLAEAARLLLDSGVSGAPVVEGERVVGMLSEKDLLATRITPRPPRYLELLGGIIFLDDVGRFQSQLEKTAAVTVEQVMTRDVATVEADAPIEEAAGIIVRRGVNRVPVVENGRLVGIVTRSDVLRGTLGQ